jgi:hypothetical protein
MKKASSLEDAFFMASAIGASHATCAKRLVFANGEGVVGGGLATVANEK